MNEEEGEPIVPSLSVEQQQQHPQQQQQQQEQQQQQQQDLQEHPISSSIGQESSVEGIEEIRFVDSLFDDQHDGDHDDSRLLFLQSQDDGLNDTSHHSSSKSDTYSQVDPEMIRQATQLAIKDAVAMKRSDSFLSTDSNEDDIDSDHNENGSSSLHHREFRTSILAGFPSPLSTRNNSHSASISYMENASFEATLASPGKYTVMQDGNIIRTSSTMTVDNNSDHNIHNDDEMDDHASTSSSKQRRRLGSSTSCRNSILSDGSGNEGWSLDTLVAAALTSMGSPRLHHQGSERMDFQRMSQLIHHPHEEAMMTSPPSVPPQHDTGLSVGDDKTENDFPCLEESQENLSPPGDVTNGPSLEELLKPYFLERPYDLPLSSESQEVFWLQLVFRDFCRPSPSPQAIESIYMNEVKGTHDESVELPVDVVIERPNPLLAQLFGTPLLSLPREWAMSLFRILLRILTNESDSEYDASIMRTCPWYEETFGNRDDEVGLGPPKRSVSSLMNQRSFSTEHAANGAETTKLNQMYSIVRLRACCNSIEDHLLGVMDTILSDPQHYHLRGPVTRLLGVLCTGGISVKQLRCVLDLATRPDAIPMTRLLLIRAIRTAASGCSRSLLGKADPRSFFSFTSGTGLTRTINLEKSSWPFKNDFGMAVWFRAECFTQPSTLLRIVTDGGDGMEIKLEPLDEAGVGSTAASLLTVSVLEDGQAVQHIKVRQAILLERVWYHVAVRHTRSRLKGVFSMASREQLVVFLDGKNMVTDSVGFPVVKESKSMSIAFCENFDGQTGTLYVFNNNVSDATLKALYEKASNVYSSSLPRRLSLDWNSHQADVVKRSKILGLEMKQDDVEDMVLSYRTDKDRNREVVHVLDVDEDDSGHDAGSLSRAAFNSRLYLAWDPMRIVGQVVLDLHSGAHVRMTLDSTQEWKIDSLQDVLGSVGGIRVVLPIIQAILAPDVVANKTLENEDDIFQRCVLCSAIPDVLLLFSSLVRDHHDNAREMMRCGAVDLLEQLLWGNKHSPTFRRTGREVAFSMFSALSIFPRLSRLLVDAVMELRATCSHYVGLETKVFIKLIFNLPLWLGESQIGISVYSDMIPCMSSMSKQSPEKIRDCVGIDGIVKVIVDLVETEVPNPSSTDSSGFSRNERDFQSLCSPLSTDERWHVCEVLFGMLFDVIFVGSTVDEVALVVGALSKACEREWEAASNEVNAGQPISLSGGRELRHRFTLRSSALILFLIQSPQAPADFLPNLVHACGSVQACAAWILSALVNSYCDRIRAIGVRCFVAYLQITSSHPDAPLTLDDRSGGDIPNTKSSEGKTLQENTLTLISSVGHGLLNSNVGKGLASIGPGMRSNGTSSPKLTPRVAYKLLWHLLKSHRYRVGTWTQASLVGMVFDQRSLVWAIESPTFKDSLFTTDTVFQGAATLNWTWVSSLLQDNTVSLDAHTKGELGMNTIVRLLRFLPADCIENWLVILAQQAARSEAIVDMLSSTADWQPCLFQLSSELLESLVESTSKLVDDGDLQNPSVARSPNAEPLTRRLDLALDLYALLLANLFRRGGEKALIAMEDCASLQRMCVNGQQVLILILSKLVENLADSGILPLERVAIHSALHDKEQSRVLLKRSAKFVTDTLLSNSAKAMTMPEAVDCWRSLRHFAAIVVAMINRLGIGAKILSDLAIQSAPNRSRSSFGIRLSDDELSAADIKTVLAFSNEGTELDAAASTQTRQDSKVRMENAIDLRVCVSLAAQVLALLDVFIFPDSLDATLPVSQLHGLALVRNTESRIGGGQGPLLASLVRLSLVLMNQLEPVSVSLLQCCSRLRCFLHWIFEMIRESEALDGYSATFNKLTAPFDRLVLSVIVQCRQVLRRVNALQVDLQESSATLDSNSREPRKKTYRRLLRVSLEMREILVTVLEQRIDLLRASFSENAFEALKLGLEANENGEGSKEDLVQKLLCSDWVVGFEGTSTREIIAIPNIFRAEETSKAVLEFRELHREAQNMSVYFEKSLNACFERYLDAQRKWAETGAVRDLEYEGDTCLKKLSTGYTASLDDFSKVLASRRQSAGSRFHNIHQKVTDIWAPRARWRLSQFSGTLGKRVVLFPNENFDDHSEASYELLMGREREREERDRVERRRRKEELAELMKRNSAAFVPIPDNTALDDEDDRDGEAKFPSDTDDLLDGEDGVPSANVEEDEKLIPDADVTPYPEPGDDVTDGWARSFIWTESESVVARFENVILVSLEFCVEGKILLTTHAVYFHQTGDKVNSITRETFSRDRAIHSAELDRRWRLNRLTEVHGRRYLLRAQALELFFSDSCELFINFADGQKDRNRFYAKLRNSCRVPMLFSAKTLNPRTLFKKSNLTELWRKRRISNFDYIMSVNRMAGRTFNDIAQYPVFPWILADYSSEKIDLSDSRMYRDLSKPVGALNPDRLAQLIERYKELEQFGFSENERFLYGSHYSSPGVILHFLIRQEPFTSMAIDLQSGRFDCPDRLFFDLAETWRGCNTSSSDVKELIPEFFTLPEMFLNTNNFPLGKTQRGQVIENVRLPPWAKGSAHEFVRMHRLAMESEYVSRNLHHWIDLVFGFKQRGPEAEAAHNIFHHLSYEGAVDLDKISDEVDRQATESHIQNFGQTPSQLLVKESHLARLSAEECWVPLINNMSSTVRLRCHTPGKQYGGKKGGCGSAIKIGIQADMITVIYSDLKVGTFRWYPKAAKNRLMPDKLRLLPNRSGSYSRAVIKRGSAAPKSMDDTTNKFSVGNWSVAVTLGGYEKEQSLRRTLMPSRLASAKDALYTDSATLIVSCGYWDNTIKVHSTDAWKLECADDGGHYGCIRCLAVTDDGAFMVSGGQDCTCRVWIIDHPDLAVSLADGYTQTALGHSAYGEQILYCSHVLWGHENPVSCVEVSSELDVVVSGALDGRICAHSLRRGEFIRSFKPVTKATSAPSAVYRMALDKQGRLVTYMGDGTLQSYTINGICMCVVDAQEAINDMKITGEVLISGGDRCHVYIRDLASLKILSGLDLNRHGPIRSISLTPEDLNPTPQHLFIGSDDGMISIVDREEIKAATGGR